MIGNKEALLLMRAAALAEALGHKLAEDFTYNPRNGCYSSRCERCGRVVRANLNEGRIYGPAARVECGEAG
jgi:hypothetical protein